MRELGLGALQAWQALSEAQRRGRGRVDVAILFTDLVGFSSWALEAGDDAALDEFGVEGGVQREHFLAQADQLDPCGEPVESEEVETHGEPGQDEMGDAMERLVCRQRQ